MNRVDGSTAIPNLMSRSEHPQMRTVFLRPAAASEDALLLNYLLNLELLMDRFRDGQIGCLVLT